MLKICLKKNVPTHRSLYKSQCVFGQQPKRNLHDNINQIDLIYINIGITLNFSHYNLYTYILKRQ